MTWLPRKGRRMSELQRLVFGPFQLDLRDERLWCGPEVVRLPPKAFAVLSCLVTQAGQLVTKDALLAAIWPDIVVSEDVITVAMRQLPRVLGDQTHTPRFIETVHGRGYRFIAPVRTLLAPGGPETEAAAGRRPGSVARRTLWGVTRPWPSSRSDGPRHARARDRWGSSRGSPASARPPWYTRLWPRWRPPRTSGSGTANAWTTMERVKLICLF